MGDQFKTATKRTKYTLNALSDGKHKPKQFQFENGMLVRTDGGSHKRTYTVIPGKTRFEWRADSEGETNILQIKNLKCSKASASSLELVYDPSKRKHDDFMGFLCVWLSTDPVILTKSINSKRRNRSGAMGGSIGGSFGGRRL